MGSSFFARRNYWAYNEPPTKGTTMTPVKNGYRREHFGNGVYIDWKIR